MKRTQFGTLSISIVAAVILWAVASMFEDDSRWTELAPGDTPDLTIDSRPADTPVRTNTSAASCEQAESAMLQKVDESRYCTVDDDCTLFDYGYPIQCLTSVTKNEITALRREYDNYHASCQYRVYYDCPSGEAERVAVCRSNRCEVELVTPDLLQDETLKHLGIQ